MLFHHVKVFFRLLTRETPYYAINISGLALGLASFFLILLYVNYEFSYDSFHSNADKIYRVEFGGSRAPVQLVPAAKSSIPAVVGGTRLMFTTSGTTLVIRDAKGNLFEENCYFADSSFFNVFSYNILSGDPRNILPGKQHIVLTKKAALKYFSEVDIAGRQLEFASSYYENKLFTVSGVIDDPPLNSQFRFDVIIDYAHHGTYTSTSWEEGSAMSFIKLREDADPDEVTQNIKRLIAANSKAPQSMIDQCMLKPLTGLHFVQSAGFDFQPRNKTENLLVLSSVAALILIIACINFINLTTAKAADKIRTACLRQIVGAGKRQIVLQLVSESVLVAVVSTAIAAGLVFLMTPFYESFSGVRFMDAFDPVKNTYLPLLPILPIAIGVISGLYPGWLISSARPVSILTRHEISDSRSTFRNILVTLQFGISSFLVVGTLIINGQLEYLKGMNLGFEADQLVVLNAGGPGVGERIHAIRQEFTKSPGIKGVAGALTVPGDNAYMMGYAVSPSVGAESIGQMPQIFVDPLFTETMGLTVILGSGEFLDVVGDTTDVLLNETAVNQFVAQYGNEWTNPVGKFIYETDMMNGQTAIASYGRIVGVVKDFNFQSLHHAIRPLIIRSNYNLLYKLLVRIQPEYASEALNFIQAQWSTLVVGDRPFTYQFLDDRFALSYARDDSFRTIFRLFAAISIVISCIGLYGLVLYITERRSREISIRKVLGAELSSLLVLFGRQFISPVAIAFLIIIPLSWWSMNGWLQQFAYQNKIGAIIFLQAGALTVVVALITVITRVFKVSLANPVVYLKEK